MGMVGTEEGTRGCLDGDWREGHVHFASACLEGVAARGDLPLYHRSRDASCTFRGMEHKTRLIISSEPGYPTHLDYTSDMCPELTG